MRRVLPLTLTAQSALVTRKHRLATAPSARRTSSRSVTVVVSGTEAGLRVFDVVFILLSSSGPSQSCRPSLRCPPSKSPPFRRRQFVFANSSKRTKSFCTRITNSGDNFKWRRGVAPCSTVSTAVGRYIPCRPMTATGARPKNEGCRMRMCTP